MKTNHVNLIIQNQEIQTQLLKLGEKLLHPTPRAKYLGLTILENKFKKHFQKTGDNILKTFQKD